MEPLIGLQIGAISFADEGVEVIDLLAEKAGVTALFVATQAFDRGVQGRQIKGRPHPGHGPNDFDDDHWGGSYVTQHAEHYRGSVLQPYRAPDRDVEGYDVLASVIPKAKERGLQTYSFVLENSHSGLTRYVPNWSKVLQIDAWGRSDSYACVRNPDYIAWWLSLVEDQVRHYELDGMMFGSERNGPLGNVLEDGGFARDGRPYCFCSYCVAAGERRGIDSRRAAEGYVKLYELARDDGDASFIRFLRLLLTYPEIMAWEQLWHEGYEELQKRLYGAVKFLAPDVQVGWHVWHHNTFSPLYRAEMDYTRIREYSDFVKPVMYNNCAGYRLHHHISAWRRSIFREIDEQTVYDLFRQSLGYDEAMPFDELPGRGLSTDYVRRETTRTLKAIDGRARVYPGLDVNIPTPPHVKQTGPDDIAESLTTALDAGADGVILSRKYSEMALDNLEAVGTTLRHRAPEAQQQPAQGRTA
ncbi:hypothetical protein OHA18_20405 [Kribbella sp. NBC_00709]|uniref:hypothetical protein n=1 Tax=Kribbella sp. NBC_00709 TaxID=2975972 RepID=UPI002E27B0AF|nr:hypothetical protein [Kribbella sp. NBC_00709]